jgi:hypothetical protein
MLILAIQKHMNRLAMAIWKREMSPACEAFMPAAFAGPVEPLNSDG